MRVVAGILLSAWLTLSMAGEAPAGAADAKLPVPAPADAAQSRKLVQELLSEKYAGAKSPTEKRELAVALLNLATEITHDPAGKYVCLTESLRFAIEGESLEDAHRAIQHLQTLYDVDGDALQRKALMDHLSTAKDPEVVRALAALKALDAAPDDPAANLLAGRYLCFRRQWWAQGLPFLARSGDAALKTLAEQESTPPAEGPARLALADAWWDYAAKEAEPSRGAIQRRAAAWYTLAVGELSGFSKAKIEKRIADATRSGPLPSLQSGAAPTGKWDHVDPGAAEVAGDVLKMTVAGSHDWKKSAVSTHAKYASGIEISAMARTSDSNIRFHAFKGAELIVNWELNKKELRVHRPHATKDLSDSVATAKVTPLEPNQWAQIVWRITPNGMDVRINNQPVFSETREYPALVEAPVLLGTCFGSTLEIKSFSVVPYTPRR